LPCASRDGTRPCRRRVADKNALHAVRPSARITRLVCRRRRTETRPPPARPGTTDSARASHPCSRRADDLPALRAPVGLAHRLPPGAEPLKVRRHERLRPTGRWAPCEQGAR
jgi:hypothetical protein